MFFMSGFTIMLYQFTNYKVDVVLNEKSKFVANLNSISTELFLKKNPQRKTISPPISNCIEENICEKENSTGGAKSSNIYYYVRTNFTKYLALPINKYASITHNTSVVPRKIHFVLFGDGKKVFKFYYMIAILAANRFVKPEKIYFWHDNLPVGKYWEETKRRVNNLYLVHRERPTEIYGRPVKVIEHCSDIVRLEVLLEYGGMYFDTDSVVVNPIDTLLKYDLTMGRAVSNTLANGIMFAKPWSDFMKIWHNEYKIFNDNEWSTSSVVKANQLSKLYPNLVHVEETSLCRPNFQELNHLFGSKSYDWKHKNYVVHLYMRFSKGRGNSLKDIQNWNTTVGQIMRYIYYDKDSPMRK